MSLSFSPSPIGIVIIIILFLRQDLSLKPRLAWDFYVAFAGSVPVIALHVLAGMCHLTHLSPVFRNGDLCDGEYVAEAS